MAERQWANKTQHAGKFIHEDLIVRGEMREMRNGEL